MLVAASLLSASIKFKGRITVQFQGKNQVRLLFAQSNDLQELRGLAQWQGELNQEQLMADLKQGTLAIMMDPEVEGGKQYQGIVEWQGDSLAHSLEGYFNRSEQIPTRLWLAVNSERAAGFLIQVMPSESGRSDKIIETQDHWEHIQYLTATITPNELLNLDTKILLHRLYVEEDVRVFSPKPVIFKCKCSQTRSENALKLLGEAEVEQELKAKQIIVVTCEFCNKEFQFDRADVARIFNKP
jgi:molecular chaperone Hsp33